MSDIATATSYARNSDKDFHKAINGLYSVVGKRDDVSVYYRGTRVCHFHNDEAGRAVVTLNNGGWQTMTTKKVIQAALMTTGWDIWQKRGEWYVQHRNVPAGVAPLDFSNFMELHLNVPDEPR